MTIQETKLILAIIAETYQKFEITDTAVSIWASIFEKETINDVKKALLSVIATDRFAPTPARIKESLQAQKIETFKKSLTPTEQKMLDKDPALVWAGAHKKMLTCQDSYRAFLASPTMPQWVKDAFEAVGGIKLCLMEDSSRLYPRFEKAWNDGKARYLGQETNLLANEQHQLLERR